MIYEQHMLIIKVYERRVVLFVKKYRRLERNYKNVGFSSSFAQKFVIKAKSQVMVLKIPQMIIIGPGSWVS